MPGVRNMQQQACMTAAAQNIKRLVKHMRRNVRNLGIIARAIPPFTEYPWSIRETLKYGTLFLKKSLIVTGQQRCIAQSFCMQYVSLAPDF